MKALAADYTIQDGPGEDGEMFERAAPAVRTVSRRHSPMNRRRGSANGGAYPPDLSLITKSRPGWYGTFNQLFNGIGGPEYVYSAADRL